MNREITIQAWDLLPHLSRDAISRALCDRYPNWQLLRFELRGSNLVCEFDMAPERVGDDIVVTDNDCWWGINCKTPCATCNKGEMLKAWGLARCIGCTRPVSRADARARMLAEQRLRNTHP